MTDTTLPRILTSTRALGADGSGDDNTDARIGTGTDTDTRAAGAIWRMTEPTRGLDANVIQLPEGASIEEHDGPGLDVLVYVVSGSGVLTRGAVAGPLTLMAGDVVWLPARTRRGFTGGAGGLHYLTVHARKPGLQIGPPPTSR